jgi:hypothetical protein
LSQFSPAVEVSPLLQSFARVLVQDSTLQRLPAHLADLFPGGGNQSSSPSASLKIQWVCDLKNSAVAQIRLSGFTRNDQHAAADILEAAGPGDLVLRDLGYLSVPVLGQLKDRGVFFLTRHLQGTRYYEPTSGQLLDLAAQLRRHPSLDLPLLAGAERVPVRLAALPVPEEVANRRRQKARAWAQHRQRPPPSKEYLFLMGWNLLLTNVSASLWPPKALVAVYRLRWRIEITFKTWKSHLGLRHLNCRTAPLLELSALTQLLFCALNRPTVRRAGTSLWPGSARESAALGPHPRTVRLLVLGHHSGHLRCSMAGVLIGAPCFLRSTQRPSELLRKPRHRRNLSLTRMRAAPPSREENR